MGRIAIWSANTCLFVACCWLLAANLNQVAAAMLVPTSASPSIAPAPAAGPVARTWEDRKVILDNDPFDVSTLIPAAPVQQEEELEETKLPLRLLGTAASTREDISWAAVEDQDQRREVVVKLGDKLAGRATVVGIERKRIVLDNRGKREELTFDEDAAPAPVKRRQARRATPPRRPARANAARDAASRVRRLSENRFQVQRDDVVEMAGRNPAEIFSSARILPKYEDGQMVGIQLNNVKAGSLFETIGIQDGDTITNFNGIQIDSPQGSAEVLREITQAEQFEIQVTGSDGTPRKLTYELEE